MNSAWIAEMSGIHPGHLQDTRPVVSDFPAKQITVPWRSMPMCVQLKTDSIICQPRDFGGIQIVQYASCHQVPVVNLQVLSQRAENLIFVISLQSLSHGKLFDGAPRTGAARFIPQVKRALQSDLLVNRDVGVTRLP